MTTMTLGMMWRMERPALYDDLQSAIAYYRAKYQSEPDCIFIPPTQLDPLPEIHGIELHRAKWIIKNNLWIGRKE